MRERLEIQSWGPHLHCLDEDGYSIHDTQKCAGIGQSMRCIVEECNRTLGHGIP